MSVFRIIFAHIPILSTDVSGSISKIKVPGMVVKNSFLFFLLPKNLLILVSLLIIAGATED